MRRAIACARLLLAVGTLAGCASNPSVSVSSATTSDPTPRATVPPTTFSSTTTSDLTVAADSNPAGPTCSTYVDLVTKATAAEATLSTPDPSIAGITCLFVAGSFHGGFGLGLSAAGATPFASAELDRSGRWEIRRWKIVGDHLIDLRLTNDTSGSDTYPPTVGPPQHDRSVAAGVALMRLLARS